MGYTYRIGRKDVHVAIAVVPRPVLLYRRYTYMYTCIQQVITTSHGHSLQIKRAVMIHSLQIPASMPPVEKDPKGANARCSAGVACHCMIQSWYSGKGS